ncbi:Kxd1p Ecym_2216 [Eremothecium cymbalariae DBVPG|uniref:Biogenesis of lysosome-related organelles complex 1 subunit KXD1 n=1 Tax=Eremothecium cymbalariae (strain CBS 270.75 / DBVPG 7215 / KCTC 17166 / NRRL Y-17582) TaxID=931890 RepID=G8JP60_ERECY|nr:Hypothetical protein Ecym_2216 [Eremothecium cymbalariae DBVPG\
MDEEMVSETRSRTPSISSRQFVIPEDGFTTLDTDDSSQESAEDDEEGIDREGCTNNSHDSSSGFENDQSSNNEVNSHGTVFSDLMPPNTTFFTGNQVTPMFDTSKFLFESLTQAFNSVDFSEAISLQTKSSAMINSKSTELKMLIDEVQEKLKYYHIVFENGGHTARRIRHNLRDIARKVEKLKPIFAKDFPIEYNQSIEKVYDRQ